MPCGGLLEARLPQDITWMGRGIMLSSGGAGEATRHVPTSLRHSDQDLQARALLRQRTRTSAGRGGLSQAHPASAGSSFITCSFSRTTPDRLLLTLLTYPKPSEACRNVHATDTGRSMPAGTTKKPLLSDPEAPPGAAWGQGR